VIKPPPREQAGGQLAIAMPEQDLGLSPASSTREEDTVLVRLRYDLRKEQYAPLHSQAYKNNLLAAVGFFELTNALDFPANVWNNYPVPTFVVGLMATGGAVCLLWTLFGIWDLVLSLRNIHFLREERRKLLHSLHANVEVGTQGGLPRQLLTAGLDINYRELGWEYVDRAIMDGFMSVSGLLVAIGTIMAIWGINHTIFMASNMLSGYVGNSFIAVYALINSAWSIYMWRRATKHMAAVRRASDVPEDLKRRLTSHSRRHQLYAGVNMITVIVSSAGSLASAENWQGYVVIAPCIFGSVFANLYWRYCLAYSRSSFQKWSASLQDYDIQTHLYALSIIQSRAHSLHGRKVTIEDMVSTKTKLTTRHILQLVQQLDIVESFGTALMRQDAECKVPNRNHPDSKCLYRKSLYAMEAAKVLPAANTALETVSPSHFRDQERFLLELYGCYLCAFAPNEGSDDFVNNALKNTSGQGEEKEAGQQAVKKEES
jgi:hypothetical protein